MEDYRLEQTGQEVQNILNGAAMNVDLQTEVERATDAEGTLQENIDAEAQARQDADGLLQQGIDDEAQRAKDAEEANAGEIEGIKALIPATASDANKLADTNYVNSSIQTATAEYRGDYNVVTDLHLAIDATHEQIETLLPTVIAEADKNDYCYVMIPTNASTPTEIAKIERYKMTSEGWKFEYDVNNSTFTAEEWAAIKSGITSGLVAKLNALPTNADLLLLLAGKQDVLAFDATPVPESNNPVKSGGVYSAIDDEKTARLNSDTAIHTELDGLQVKVPATASSDNKLVDQNQMNSSISTATATFRGDWNVVSDLNLAVDATRAQIAALLPTVISTADNNDYCYVEIPTSAETPTQIERVERYKFNGTAWAFEYVLNNSGFTAAQWAAINSMITSGLVAKLSALPTNADLLAMLAQKQDNLTFDSTPTENSTNPVTSGGVFAADKALSDAIEAILLLIPSAASALNKLVDTSLMNSSISTATATFRGTYNLVSDLGLGIDATEGQIAAALSTAISTADNNDYAFVQIPTSAETPAQIARTDRYKFNGTAWAFEYTLNTSGFTAAQWAAINSTITSALVAKLNALPTAAELQEALGVLTSGITDINQKIPATASQSNKLVDNASMENYIAQVINILDASFNVTSTDGHITLHITQVDGKITAVQVQGSDIASAADLALKASQADLTALTSRVTTAEGNITSLTGRMGTAETNIVNLQQLYNDLQQSKPVPVTALPSTGQQQGVIYRLAGTTSYSDYMWNGSSWVLMATYNNAIDPRPKKASQNLVTSGGVFDNIGAFDISELNATENPHTLAQYADLSAALAAIPTDYQKGGMSIKFVQTSDNKYVQFRCKAQSFSSNTEDWVDTSEEINIFNSDKNIYHNTFLELLDGVEEFAISFNNSEAVSLLKLHDVPQSDKYSIETCGRLSNGRCILRIVKYGTSNRAVEYYPELNAEENHLLFDNLVGEGIFEIRIDWSFFGNDEFLMPGVLSISNKHRIDSTCYVIDRKNDFLELIPSNGKFETRAINFLNSDIVSLLRIEGIPTSERYSILFIGRLSNGRCLLRLVRYGQTGSSNYPVDYYPSAGQEQNYLELDNLIGEGKFVFYVDWSRFSAGEFIFAGDDSTSNKHKIALSCYYPEIDYVKESTFNSLKEAYQKKVPMLQSNPYRTMLSSVAKEILTSDDDVVVGILGDSIWAGVGPSDFTSEQMKTLPPNMENPNPSYWLYLNGIKNKPIWRRFNADDIFTESGTFTTEKEKFNTADGNSPSDGKPETSTRQCGTDGASVGFSWNLGDYEKMAFVHRLRYDGAEKVVVSISGGNGKVLVKHNQLANPIEGYTDGEWVEANGYEFTQLVQRNVYLHRSTDSFPNFITYFKAVTGISGIVTITFTKDDSNTARYLYYWGYGMWNGKTIILENCARGGISLKGIVGHISDDLEWRHPDLVILECPLANTVNGGENAQYISENFEAMIFNEGPLKDTTNYWGASYSINNLKKYADNGKVIYFIANYFRGYVDSTKNAFVRYCPTQSGTPQDRNGEMMFNLVRNLLSSKSKDYVDYANIVLDMAEEKGMLWYDIMTPNLSSPLNSVLTDDIHPNEFGAYVQGYLVSKILSNA